MQLIGLVGWWPFSLGHDGVTYREAGITEAVSSLDGWPGVHEQRAENVDPMLIIHLEIARAFLLLLRPIHVFLDIRDTLVELS